MKKSYLLDIVCALVLFVMPGSASAAIIASNDASITGTDQSHTQMPAVSPASSSGADSTQAGESLKSFTGSTSSESPHSDSHVTLLLLMIVASVFGVLSEIFHRRAFRRRCDC